MKHIEVVYLKGGTFVGGEEECECDLGIRPGDECVVMKKARYDSFRESVRRLVGEWRQLSMDDQLPNNFLRGVDKCADELTAFLAENKEMLP